MTDQMLGTLQIMYSTLEYVLKIYTMLLLKTSSSQLSMDSMVSWILSIPVLGRLAWQLSTGCLWQHDTLVSARGIQLVLLQLFLECFTGWFCYAEQKISSILSVQALSLLMGKQAVGRHTQCEEHRLSQELFHRQSVTYSKPLNKWGVGYRIKHGATETLESQISKHATWFQAKSIC